MSRTNTLLIRTPEGVVFAQILAGPVTRFLAWLLDFAVQAGIITALNYLVGWLALITPDLARALGVLFFFLIPIGYSMLLEWRWRGQTLGKRLLRIRVVDAQGLRLQFSQIALRNLLRVVDLLPGLYLVGGLAALCTRNAQRLGDMAANTVVVRIPRITEPGLESLGVDKYNSLRSQPHLCARLRQRVSPVEASVALRALVRRDLLEPGERVKLFAELADHFRGKVSFPAEVVEGIADEQFIRNVVDVLYRAESRRSRKETATSGTPTPEPYKSA